MVVLVTRLVAGYAQGENTGLRQSSAIKLAIQLSLGGPMVQPDDYSNVGCLQPTVRNARRRCSSAITA